MNIIFSKEDHRYTAGDKIYTSVSKVLGKYKNEFNAEHWSTYKALEALIPDFKTIKKGWNIDNPEFINYASSYVNPEDLLKKKESILKDWADNNHKSILKGNSYHESRENMSYAQGFEVNPFTGSKFEVNGVQSTDKTNLLSNLYELKDGFYPELLIWNDKASIAGQADKVFIETSGDKRYVDLDDYKGLALDTPIFTTNGWKTIGEINIDDIIYDGKGIPTRIKNISNIHFNPCYKIIFDNNEEIIADHEHRWEISLLKHTNKKEYYRENVVLTTEEIYDYYTNGEKKLAIELNYIKNEKIDLPIDPYILGLWLADGNRTCGTITCVNDNIWDGIGKRGYNTSINHNRKNDKACSKTIFNIRKHLIDLNLLSNKHIPDIYMLSDYDSRLDLLRGYMDGDGYYNKSRKRLCMTTTSIRQATDVRMLVTSLGYKCTIIPYKTKGFGKGNIQAYQISFRIKENPFLHRNIDYNIDYKFKNNLNYIKSIEKIDTVPTQCLEVESESHTFLVGKSFIKTHNTNKQIKKSAYKSQKMKPPLSHLADCVSGDTKLITRDGITNIKEAVGKSIEIWNGTKWSMVSPFQTKSNTKLYRVLFDDGSYLDVTSNHRFLIKYRLDKDFEEQTTLDIINKMNTTKWLPRVPNNNINIPSGNTNVAEAYDYGFVLGDGSVGSDKIIRAELSVNDKNLIFYTGERRQYNDLSYHYFKLHYEFSKSLKYDYGLPNIIFSWDNDSILRFLAGWIDADGCNQGNGIRLYGREDKLRDAQLLFTKCGIKSSLKLMSKKGIITNLGIRKNDVWFLHITKTIDIPCQRVICTNSRESSRRHKWIYIKSINVLDGQHDSYCLTEFELGQCVFNNVLTKQCNYNHYNLQISFYAWMLEEFGFTVRNLSFHHFNQMYKLKYLRSEIKAIAWK